MCLLLVCLFDASCFCVCKACELLVFFCCSVVLHVCRCFFVLVIVLLCGILVGLLVCL